MKQATIKIALVIVAICSLVAFQVRAGDTCDDNDSRCCTVKSTDPDSPTSLYAYVTQYEYTDQAARRCTQKIEFSVAGAVKIDKPIVLTQDPTSSELKIYGGTSESDQVQFDLNDDFTGPVFIIDGVSNVRIEWIKIGQETESKAPYIFIRNSDNVTLSHITLANNVEGAIYVENSEDISIEDLTVSGSTIPSADVTSEDYTIPQNITLSDASSTIRAIVTVVSSDTSQKKQNIKVTGLNLTGVRGNGVLLQGIQDYVVTGTISYASSATGTGVIIDGSWGSYEGDYDYSLGNLTIGNVNETGLKILNVDNTQDTGTVIKHLEVKASSSDAIGIDLESSHGLTFNDATIQGFQTGILVNDSNKNVFESANLKIEGLSEITSNGIVFEGTSDGNSVTQVNLNNHPLGCGIQLDTSGETTLDQIRLYNTDECGVGVGGNSSVQVFDSTYDGVAMFKMSQDNLLFDVIKTDIGTSIKRAELHKLMLSSTQFVDDVSLIGSPYTISDESNTSLPAKLSKTELDANGTDAGGNGYFFMVLLQGEGNKILGVWRGYATQEVLESGQFCTTNDAGDEICDDSCYYDSETQSKYRVYNYGIDENGDGVADDDIDLDDVADALEDSTLWSQTTASDGLVTVTSDPDYSLTTSMNCVTDSDETSVYSPDSDEDGLTDGIEANTLFTNPTKPDTDSDGLSDYEEDPDMDGCSSTATDEDGDGRPDCYHAITLDDGTKIMETNPLKADSDGDGVDDGTERHRGTNPWAIDSDGDGTNDEKDLCPMQSDRTAGCYVGGAKVIDVFCVPINLRYENVMQDISEGEISGDTYDCGDGDSDGLCLSVEDKDGDCEYDPGTETDASSEDTDGDEITDGKEDRNSDGIFYPEDTTEISSPILSDSDGDCIIDGLEDKDGDGVISLDGGETYPNLLDSDGDGLGDGDEDNNLATPSNSCNGKVDTGELSPSKEDSDGDGMLDGVDPAPFSSDTSAEYYYYKSGIDVDTDGDSLTLSEEDKNGNGHQDIEDGECDANEYDSDGDYLPDNFEQLYKTSCVAADTDGDGKTDTEELVPGYEGGRELTAEELAMLAAANGNINHSTGMENPLYYNKGCSLNTANYQATFGGVMPIIGLMGLAMALMAALRMRKVEN